MKQGEGAPPPSTPRWGLRPQTPNSLRKRVRNGGCPLRCHAMEAAAIPNPSLNYGGPGHLPWRGPGAEPLALLTSMQQRPERPGAHRVAGFGRDDGADFFGGDGAAE